MTLKNRYDTLYRKLQQAYINDKKPREIKQEIVDMVHELHQARELKLCTNITQKAYLVFGLEALNFL